MFRARGDFIVHLAAGGLEIRVDAVEQGDPHGYRTDVEVFVLDHPDCLKDVVYIDHRNLSSPFTENRKIR